MRLPPPATPSDRKAHYHRVANPEIMLPAFQRELPRLTDSPIRVTGCKLKPIVSRKSLRLKRILVLYKVTVEGLGDEEREYRMLGTGPVDEAFLTDDLGDCVRDAQGHPMIAPFERAAIYLPELRMAVQFLPVDLALPALVEMTRPDCGPALAQFLPACREGATVEHVECELKHYKPANRCVIRIRAMLRSPDGARKEQAVYAKIFADDRGAEHDRKLRALWTVARHSTALRVPEPLGYDPQRRMFVMSEVPGERDLAEWIKAVEKKQPLPPGVDLARLERAMAVVAESMRELHQSDLQLEATRRFEDDLVAMRKDVELIEARRPDLAALADGLLRDLEARAPDDRRLVPCHGGFRHKQTLGNDECLTIIDWDGLAMGNPALDAATFILRLRQEPIRNPGSCPEMDHLARVFRREFLARQPEVPRRDLVVYEAATLTERGLRTFRRPSRKDHGEAPLLNLFTAARETLEASDHGG